MQFDDLALGAAEAHPREAGGHAERLVRGAVVVVMGVDAVAPCARPFVAAEERLAGRRGPGAGCDRAAIDEQRQRRVVRHESVIGEEMFFDPQVVAYSDHVWLRV